MGERADTYPPAQVAQTGTLEGHRRGDPRGHRPRVGPRGLRGGDDEPDRRGFGLYGVGSLYDYFPNKESLVVALIERHAEEMVEVAEATFRAHEDSALNVAVRAWVEAGVRAHLASPELHKVLVEQVPKVGGPGPHRRFRGSHRSSRACLPGTPRRGGPSAGPAADRVRRCAGAGVAHAQGGR